MATNLALDDALIEEARRVSGHRTKRAVVNEALEEYVQRRRQLQILGLFNTVDYDPDFEYKIQRNRK